MTVRALRAFSVALVIVALQACVAVPDARDYTNLASNLRSQGHLRTSGISPDTSFTLANIAASFEEIAFRYEFHFEDGKLIDRPISKPLKRWQGSIRYQLTGDAVGAQDAKNIMDLTTRLSELTGIEFQQVSDGAHDMMISIASRKGRREISRKLAELGLPAYRERYTTWRRTPGWLCGATLSSARDDPNQLVYAHIFLRGETQGVLREACLHEEIAQSLGLTNDSDQARPSIFNDDHEFAHLTEHDALLLRTLYDPRLRPGMQAGEAMPIARSILASMLAEASTARN